ncbi:MAG: hypothetical protein R3Y50_09210 [Rikenellaceae bacterium]
MNKIRIITIVLYSLVLSFFFSKCVYSSEKTGIHLTQWRAMLDREAKWFDDTLYLPSELPALETLPVNAPSDGWECLSSDNGVKVTLPMTMDEYFSNGDNCWSYEGVSWVWCKFDAPNEIKDKFIGLGA